MSMTLSSATAAAKAAQAELTAPVAANHATTAANSGKNAAAPARAAGASANSASTSTAKNPAGATNAANAAANTAAQAGQQPRAGVTDAGQAAQAAASAAAPAATPLFAQLLNLSGASGDAGADSDTTGGSDDAAGSGSAAASDVMPAMIASMLNLAPAPAPVAPPAADGDAARVDAVSAALNTSATRLNLAAVNVAVTPAADAAQAAVAQAAVPPAAAVNQAALAGAARPADSDAPAANAGELALPRDARLMSLQPTATADAVRAASGAAAGGANSGADDGNGGNGNNGNSAASPLAGVNVTQGAAPAAGQAAATVKLAGTPEQWQQPLREALGDRLQLQLQRNNDHAVIRLEPPNMGAIEISIRHSAGALQVNLSANNSEVVRQLNTISDGVRQDLSNRQFADVAVTVSSSRAQAQADQGGGRNGQQRNQDDGRTPGRALTEDDSTATFAMTGE